MTGTCQYCGGHDGEHGSKCRTLMNMFEKNLCDEIAIEISHLDTYVRQSVSDLTMKLERLKRSLSTGSGGKGK